LRTHERNDTSHKQGSHLQHHRLASAQAITSALVSLFQTMRFFTTLQAFHTIAIPMRGW
jgi:hypothetical protein